MKKTLLVLTLILCAVLSDAQYFRTRENAATLTTDYYRYWPGLPVQQLPVMWRFYDSAKDWINYYDTMHWPKFIARNDGTPVTLLWVDANGKVKGSPYTPGTAPDSTLYATRYWVTGRGYLTSFTEVDPLSLHLADTSIFLRKSTAMALYQPLLGFVPYNSTNPSGYITSSSLTWTNITGKPTFATVATTGAYADLTGLPTIPAAQVQTDWNASTGLGVLLNKPAIYAFSGTTAQYTRGDGTYVTFPTDLNAFTNGPGYITGITSGQIISALGYTPYNATNPNGYITTAAITGKLNISDTATMLSPYLRSAVAATTYYPLVGNPSGFLTSVPAQSFASLTGKPTTLAGYGITDGVTNSSLTTTLGGYATTGALTSGLAGKENTITAGTTLQYWRGDKSWQTLNTSIVPELTNLYYTDTRARAAISLTTTGTSGLATYVGGVLNIPQYAAGVIADYTNTALTTGTTGNAVFYLTSDKTISGTALYTNVTSVQPIINDAAVNYSYGWTLSGDKKTLTVNAKAAIGINIALLSLTLLGTPANVAAGTSINVLVKGN